MFICYVACSLNQLAQLVTALSIWLSVLSDASSFISGIICCRSRHRPLWVPARCIGDASLPCCPGPMATMTCFVHLRQHCEFTLANTGKIWYTYTRQDLRRHAWWCVQSQPNPWTVHSMHSTEEESPGYCGSDIPDFCQQLICPKAAIKSSTTWLRHLKERQPRCKNPVLRLTLSVDSGLAQSWAADVYFIIAADGKRCVNRVSQQWESEQPEQMEPGEGSRSTAIWDFSASFQWASLWLLNANTLWKTHDGCFTILFSLLANLFGHCFCFVSVVVEIKQRALSTLGKGCAEQYGSWAIHF